MSHREILTTSKMFLDTLTKESAQTVNEIVNHGLQNEKRSNWNVF